MTVFISSFDPISQSEIDWLKEYHKNNKTEKIQLVLTDEGILPKKTRKQLLEKAIHRYSYLEIVNQKKNVQVFNPIDEDKIRQGLFKYCASGTRKEIIENGYYFEEIIAYHCKERRMNHSLRVAKLSKELAKKHGLDERIAYQMGILHDITKDKEDDFHKKILKKHDPNRLKDNHNVWHSFSAMYWLKENMYINDKRILEAIYYHTIGNPKGKYNKLLYIADKIEPGRKYDVSKETKLAFKDLDKAYDLVYDEAKDYIYETEGIHV